MQKTIDMHTAKRDYIHLLQDAAGMWQIETNIDAFVIATLERHDIKFEVHMHFIRCTNLPIAVLAELLAYSPEGPHEH